MESGKGSAGRRPSRCGGGERTGSCSRGVLRRAQGTHFGFVLALNLPWLLLPLGTPIRMAREHPFTELAPVAGPAPLAQAGT
jgi:hypothetical protein